MFAGDPDIGGRYSALSPFGLVPAALAGIDIAALLRDAPRAWDTALETDDPEQPGTARPSTGRAGWAPPSVRWPAPGATSSRS